MTPRDKAKELVGNFIPKLSDINPLNDYFNTAKECALMCVDEIILSQTNVWENSLEYWQEVKEEINKL